MEQENKFKQKVDSENIEIEKETHFNDMKNSEKKNETIKHEPINQEKPIESKETKFEEKEIEKRKNDGGIGIKEASELAMNKLADATGKKSESTVSISKQGENWQATIEIIDEEYLPGQNLKSMSDIIGVYDVSLDSSGELTNWTKKNTRKRGNVGV